MPDSPPTNCVNLVTRKLITTLCYSTNIIIYFNYYTLFNLYSFQNLGLQVENKLPIRLCRVMMQILRLWICLVWNFPFFLVTPLYFISLTVIFAALANTCDKNLQELGLQKKKKKLETMQKSIESLRITLFMVNGRFKLNISLVSEWKTVPNNSYGLWLDIKLQKYFCMNTVKWL